MKKLIDDIKKLPNKPGVYLFKDSNGHILYIGKAKNLKKRGASYLQRAGSDAKAEALLEEGDYLDHQITGSELEAMVLEAQLIQSNQPKFNVIFKTGQPFVYLLFTASVPGQIPELKIVRNRKQKGSYFGPFLEKEAARKVYDFLMKTFRLKLCKKQIEHGCLDYHLGICAGSCRPDFDQAGYLVRLDLARQALEKGHKAYLEELMEKIQALNSKQEFEQAREMYGYYAAIQKVFSYIDLKVGTSRVGHDVWILGEDKRSLHLFVEQRNVLKLKYGALRLLNELHGTEDKAESFIEENMLAYYRTYRPANRILINFTLSKETMRLYQDFLCTWHQLENPVTIICPTAGHEAALIRYATVAASQEIEKQATLGNALKKLLKLDTEPKSIDCFDISHKQGRFMVGSCVRFTDGKPDKKLFRHFHIKTVAEQNDYACLAEIVGRRYRDGVDLPDLIVIDGGKGQLSAVRDAVPSGAQVMSLAKREETVYSSRLPAGKQLDRKSFAGQMLIALRDYAHHFAISFHRKTERGDFE